MAVSNSPVTPQAAQHLARPQLRLFAGVVEGQFLRPVAVGRDVQLVDQLVVHQLAGDGAKLHPVPVGALFHLGGDPLAGGPVQGADAAGVHQVVAVFIVLHIGDVTGEELRPPLLAVLPDLADGHLLGVDAVAHPAGVAVRRL